MNIIDKAIATVAPVTARNRAVARMQLQAVEQLEVLASGRPSGTYGTNPETKWRGASRLMRSMSRWLPSLGSAYTDTPPLERARMIARSNDAYRNHLVAGAAIVRMRTNIVGTGLFPHATVNARALGLTDDAADELNARLDAAFSTWAENPLECDIEATLDFYQIQGLALVSALLGGDCFALTPMRKPATFSSWELKVQLIDGARVQNPIGSPDTPTLREGMELDLGGFPLAVWIYNRHPGDSLLTPEMLEAKRYEVFGRRTGRRRVLQVWADKDRIGSVRGVPILAPILEPLQQLETYSRSELMAAVVSSLFTVFLKRSDAGLDSDLAPMAGITGEADIHESARDSAAEKSIELSAGAIMELPEGLEPVFANPGRPNAQYDPFFKAIVAQIGARLEIPSDVLMLQYNTSYSAARAAMLEAYRAFTMRREWMVRQFCEPIRNLWLDEAVATGVIDAVGYSDPERRAAYASAMWVGPARGAMNELQEVNAAKARIDANLSNETTEAAAMLGQSWLGLHATRVRERRIARRDSIKNDPAPGAPATNGGA